MALSSVDAQYTNMRMWITENKRETFTPPRFFFWKPYTLYFGSTSPAPSGSWPNSIVPPSWCQRFYLSWKDARHVLVSHFPNHCREGENHTQTHTHAINFGVHFNAAAQLL